MTAAAYVVSAADVAEAAAGLELGTRIYRVPPGELVVGRNTRVDVPHDPEFASSVRERGVLQAITCYVYDGGLQVLMGQRRAMVAAAEGLEWVPVVIVAPPDDEGRLIDQLVENEHRAPITTADRAAAVQQLSLLGLTAEQLVHRTALRRGDVEHALAVAASPVATAAAAARPELDLGQAAAVAEFDDEPEVVEQLTSAAVTGRFEHVLQRARDNRHEATERARVLEEIRASGVTAVERYDYQAHKTLSALGISPSKHRRCPGHAAYPHLGSHYVDGHTEWTCAAEYICTEPKRHRAKGEAETDADLDDEADRLQRAEVVARNKEWRSATEVRRAWLRDFVRRQRPPAGAEAFVAAALLRGDYDITIRALQTQHVLLRELLAPLGSEEPVSADGVTERDQLAERAYAVAPKRALVLAAAALLAAWEYAADEHTWRDHPPHDPLGGPRGVDRFYLGQLAAWGYPLSEVEQLVLAVPGDAT